MLTQIDKSIKNDVLLRTIRGEKTERIPVWLMRQAGRILPEYRKVRSSVKDFKELVKNPQLAAEVTIQPIDILEVDAAIIFSDILVIPEALGLDYEMIEKKGPYFPSTIQSEQDVLRLDENNMEEKLRYVTDAIKITKKELNQRVPLIGFAGAPWTIFSYMVEGSGSKTFSKARKLLYTNPILSHKLLDKITKATIQYLKAQIHAGADVIQIFDSWAGVLTQEQYKEFSIPYLQKICDEINNTPLTVFAKGAFFSMHDLANLSCNTLGIDWNMNIKEWRKATNNQKVLQGNLDPCVLYSDEKNIEKHTLQMIEQFGPYKYIANLGHGVYPDTDFNKVKVFIETVKNYKI